MPRAILFPTAALDLIVGLLPMYGESTTGAGLSQSGMLLLTAFPALSFAALFIARRLTSWHDSVADAG